MLTVPEFFTRKIPAPAAGKIMVGKDRWGHEWCREEVVKEFQLMPLPVSAKQFFAMAYEWSNPLYWTEEGLEEIRKENTPYIRDREDTRFPIGKGDNPAINLCRYEVDAYIRWVNANAKGFKVRLPAEAEWEWALRGPENNTYPYGNTFEYVNVGGYEDDGYVRSEKRPNQNIQIPSWSGVVFKGYEFVEEMMGDRFVLKNPYDATSRTLTYGESNSFKAGFRLVKELI